MNITAKWINEYLDRPASEDEIEEVLASIGFECDSRELLPNGDTRFDFEITSNRGDCVSVIGLAHELAAATGRSVVMPTFTLQINEPSASTVTSVENAALDLCPYYSARILRGVKIGPSPDWLRDRIESVGLRSVSNVVDVTNFVLYELGQPLHTFDMSKLKEQRIVVRPARSGETMTAIDESKLKLDDSMLVIADAEVPVAIAGVMGGLDTEISAFTTDILLEAAVFDPLSVRTTSRKLKLMSDSSYRFERGIHPATVEFAANRAAQMLIDIAGGELLDGVVVEASPIAEPMTVSMRPERAVKIAGFDIPTDRMIDLLDRLGLETKKTDQTVECVIPPHRLDLTREIDLIEEVIRLNGFDRIESAPLLSVEVVGEQPEVVNRRRVDQILSACGFHETVTFSFVSDADANAFLPNGFKTLRSADEQRKAEPVLRPSVLPSLLRCRKRNQDVGHADIRLFEHAACFMLRDGVKIEQVNLAMILDAPDEQLGVRQMRAVLDELALTLIGRSAELTVRPIDIPWFQPDGSAGLFLGEEPIGTMGILHYNLQDQFGLDVPVVAAELSPSLFEMALEKPTESDSSDGGPVPGGLTSLTMQPAIQRDLSIVIDEAIAWSKVHEVVDSSELDLLEDVSFVGIYRGKQVGSGLKSVTLRLTFRDPNRTLRHEEVDPQMERVVGRLSEETGAVLRK